MPANLRLGIRSPLRVLELCLLLGRRIFLSPGERVPQPSSSCSHMRSTVDWSWMPCKMIAQIFGACLTKVIVALTAGLQTSALRLEAPACIAEEPIIPCDQCLQQVTLRAARASQAAANAATASDASITTPGQQRQSP